MIIKLNFKGTYYVDQTYDLNQLNIEARNETLLKYYQWIHFFLIFQVNEKPNNCFKLELKKD